LVEKPQIAKLMNSSQKSGDRTPRPRPENATTTGLTALVVVGGAAAAP
jgi:hypothetical protein